MRRREDQTFFLLLQVGGHQVMKEHDELSIHGDTDVVGELRHHAALHDGLAAGVWNRCSNLGLTIMLQNVETGHKNRL